MCEEIFGPVVTAYVYDDDKWAETLERRRRDVALRADRRRLRAGSAGDRRGDRRAAVCRRQLLHQRQADRRGGRSAAVRRRAGLGHQRQGRLEAESGALDERPGHQGDLQPAAPVPLPVHERGVRTGGAVFLGGLKNGVSTTVAGTRWRTASTVSSKSTGVPAVKCGAVERREGNQLLERRRPGRGRGFANLTAALVDRDRDARRGQRQLRRHAEPLVEPLDRGPANLQPDDLPLVSRCASRRREPSGRQTAACRRCTRRPSPSSNGE